MPLHLMQFFEVDKTLERIQKYQQDTDGDQAAIKHKQNRAIPIDISNMDWFDREYVKEYMCKHNQVTYNQI